MRCSSSALVLGTLAIGQAAAGAIRHANFHARRNAEAQGTNEIDVGKRDVDWSTIDWTKVVNWATVNYASGQTSTSTPAVAAPTPSTTLISVVADQAVYTSTPAAAVVSSAAPTTSSKAASTSDYVVSEVLSAEDEAKALALGLKAIGINSKTNNGAAWIGKDGPYTNEFSNASGEDLILVCWGSEGSWVNAVVPLITVSLPSGGKTTLSFANGNSGACAAIYSDTELVNGQICNSWIEHTYGPTGVLDVSREVHMSGHSIEAVGPSCTTNMDTCVFVCDSGDSCLTGYSLKNCANGSQPGANYGQYNGADSGGCGGLGNAAAIKTCLS